MSKLVKPSEAYKHGYLESLQEFIDNNEQVEKYSNYLENVSDSIVSFNDQTDKEIF